MIVVVGGHSRKIGKSAVVAGLIRALQWANWTAIKVTTHQHEELDLAEELVVMEEHSPTTTDSGRYLAAGAARAYWVAAPHGALAGALPAVKRIIAESRHTIIESNSILDHLCPDLYLAVIDPEVGDWKASARRHLEQADALLVVARGNTPESDELSLPTGCPRFTLMAPAYESDDLIRFVCERLETGQRQATSGKSSCSRRQPSSSRCT
jgi:hypothetical protein